MYWLYVSIQLFSRYYDKSEYILHIIIYNSLKKHKKVIWVKSFENSINIYSNITNNNIYYFIFTHWNLEIQFIEK